MKNTLKKSAIFAALAFVSAASYGDGYWSYIQEENQLRLSSEYSIREFSREFPDLETSQKFLSQNPRKTFSKMQEGNPHTWILKTFQFVEGVLGEVPPSFENVPARDGAFLIVDYPFLLNNKKKATSREAREAWISAMYEVYGGRAEKLIKGISEAPESGVDIWKFYNCGIVFKSAAACVAIDLRCQHEIPFTEKEIAGLVEKIEVLFFTHPHGDHIDLALIEAFLKAGKKVYAPVPESISKDLAKKYPNFIALYKAGDVLSVEVSGARVLAYGGAHLQWSPTEFAKPLPNNLYLVDIAGVKIVHTGDNGDVKILEKIGNENKVDVLMPAIWAKMITGITLTKVPRVIPIHEQELGHGALERVSHRWIFMQISNMKTGGGEYDPQLVPWTVTQIEDFRKNWKGDFPKFALLSRAEKINLTK